VLHGISSISTPLVSKHVCAKAPAKRMLVKRRDAILIDQISLNYNIERGRKDSDCRKLKIGKSKGSWRKMSSIKQPYHS
jgi:hypothetical protein